MKILPKFAQLKANDRRARAYTDMLRQEAKIGGELFGPVPAGHRREFFCLDKYTWIWHEEWTDEHKQHRIVTTRYDVRSSLVLKAQDRQPYQPVAYDEAINLYHAVELYEKRVNQFYNQQHQTA